MRWFRVGHGLFAIVKNLKSGLLGRPRSEDLPSDDGDNQMNGYWVGPYTGSNTGRMVSKSTTGGTISKAALMPTTATPPFRIHSLSSKHPTKRTVCDSRPHCSLCILRRESRSSGSRLPVCIQIRTSKWLRKQRSSANGTTNTSH
jgi:hypothetical protein